MFVHILIGVAVFASVVALVLWVAIRQCKYLPGTDSM